MPALAIVAQIAIPRTELLILGEDEVRRITVEERDVRVPLISLSLREFYVLGDEMVDAGERYGRQLTARLTYIDVGAEKTLTGVVVPLLGGPSLVVPIGFFADA